MPQETMSAKQKRMMEAARLRHMKDMSTKEISKHIGVAEGTVRNYFASDEMEQFKRFYSDQQLFELEQSLEQDVQDGNKLANNLLARAIQHDDASPNTLVRASKEAQKIRERKIDMLQELGVIQKPKERKEVTENKKGEDLQKRLQQAYEKYNQEEDDEVAEVEQN
jgi:DNA-binding transcriptional regulator LsrR (DeoR family)